MIHTLLFMIVFIPTSVRADNDPIKEELDKARIVHSEAISIAKTKLVQAIDAKLREVAGKGELENAKSIKSQKEAFEESGTLPTATILSGAKGEYESDLRKAKVSLRNALMKAKTSYTKALKLDEAGALDEEIKELADAPSANAQAKQPVKKEPKVIATWAHQVGNNGNVAKRDTFELYSNGRINNPNGRDTWQRQGRVLILTWQNAAAPGGAWKDVVTLSADGKSYSGKNNKGTPIHGTLVDTGKKK